MSGLVMQKFTPPRETQPHTTRSQILRRCQKVGGQFVINGQAPSFDIKVTAPMPLSQAAVG